MENKNQEVRLTGEWRVNRTFNVKNTNEQKLMLFGKGQHIVEFSSNGIITERSGDEVSTTKYHYNPETKTICIQESRRRQPSPLSGRPESTYRVVPVSDWEMYFRCPVSIEEDSLDTEFEMILLERY